MHYLFLGEDNLSKDLEIESVKKSIFSKNLSASYNDALHFDYQILHGDKCDPATLKKALIALPTIAEKRIVVIRNGDKLNKQNKDLLTAFLSEKPPHIVCIIDSHAAGTQNAFLKKLATLAKVQVFDSGEDINIFGITNALSAKDPKTALKLLRELLAKGDHPLQIMGGLIWFWGKNRNRISRDKFREGLQYLQEADLNIKRSRLNGDNALEVLLVKIYSLIAY